MIIGSPNLQRYIVRILVVIPVYSVASWFSLQLANHEGALYVETIRDCYEAFVVYSFLALVLTAVGGESSCVSKMKDEEPLVLPFPFCCLEPYDRDAKLLKGCKQFVLQFVFVKPIFALTSLIMMAIGKYDTIAYQCILTIVYNLSYTLALYALLIFYLATKHALLDFKPVRKFFAVKAIIFLTFWQAALIGFIPNMTDKQAVGWKNFILCLEVRIIIVNYILIM